MTIAKVSVDFQLAFPQGLLPREVQEELTMLLLTALKNERQVVEFDITRIHTKVDPFDKADVVQPPVNVWTAAEARNPEWFQLEP